VVSGSLVVPVVGSLVGAVLVPGVVAADDVLGSVVTPVEPPVVSSVGGAGSSGHPVIDMTPATMINRRIGPRL
jgi:hypothetical protein